MLDAGADGVIIPLVRTPDDVRRAVAACRYPPLGIRGSAPCRPSRYSRDGGPDYCVRANETVLCIVQIEHIDAPPSRSVTTANVLSPRLAAASIHLSS